MKKSILSLFAILAMAVSTWAGSTPKAFSYQAVVRNAADELVANQQIGMQISILKGSATGTAVYVEKQTPTTNEVGLVTISIGKGTATTGKFAAIDWSTGTYFIKTQIDPNGGTNYTLTTNQQLLSVPYAEYAYTSHRVDSLISLLKQMQTDGQISMPPATSGINTTTGALVGEFSVSASKKVKFSRGNLQYQASTKKWQFAGAQYTIIGNSNSSISSSYTGWIDLFGWGTSGYNSKYPYMTSTTGTDYGNGTNDIAGTNYDWGKYNAISNGGNTAGQWRTLTSAEWTYLLSTRTDATSKRGKATVNGVTGLVILPDSWTIPSGLTFSATIEDFTTNVYTKIQWANMEVNGAVFLPAAGSRKGTDVSGVGTYGYYWSSSTSTSSTTNAYILYFSGSGSDMNPSIGKFRYDGRSVRLVQDVQ